MVPDFQTIMLPLLKTLQDEEQHTLSQVMDKLAEEFNLSSEDLKLQVPSGQMGLFRNRIGWARTYLKNAGLIEYANRGVYKISKEGKKLLSTNPTVLRMKQLDKLPQYKAWRSTFATEENNSKNVSTIIEESNQTPEEILGNTIETLNKQLTSELLERLKDNTFQYFEDFVVKLLMAMGYGASWKDSGSVTGKTGDGGIDGIIYQDRLGLDAVYIQAKRFTNNSVGSPEIRNFVGSLAVKGVTKGVFLTTSFFSKEAHATAQESKHHKIILIDGKHLADLALEHNLGVQVEKTILVKKIDLDFFNEE